MQFYTGDWLKDTGVLSVAAAGAWIRLLVAMWDAERRGELSLPIGSLARIIGVESGDAEKLIAELGITRVANVLTDSNGLITVQSRRMMREEKDRESNRLRAERHYKNKNLRNSNENLTVYSSSSSSISSSKQEQIATQSSARQNSNGANSDAWKSDETSVALLEFLKNQKFVDFDLEGSKLLDHGWWEATAEACAGVEIETLSAEFARMGAWLSENPSRRPTPKGTRRFVRTWLERAHERERRFNAQKG